MRTKTILITLSWSLLIMKPLAVWGTLEASDLCPSATSRAEEEAHPAPLVVEEGVFMEGLVDVTVDKTRQAARVTIDRVKIYRAAGYSFDNLSVSLLGCREPIRVAQDGTCTALMRYPLGAVGVSADIRNFDSGYFPINLPASGNQYLAVAMESRVNGTWYFFDYRNIGWFTFGSEAPMSGGKISVGGTWRNPYSGQTGSLNPSYLTDEFSFFDFGDPNNPEVFVKVLGTNDPDYYQLLVGASTTFEYSLTFQGCGQIVQFFKPGLSTQGYANGKAIAKSGCSPQPSCPNISGNWTASLANSCGGAGTGPVTVIQQGCGFSFQVPGVNLLATGTLSGYNGTFSFVQTGSCVANGSGTVAVNGNTVTGTFSGTSTSTEAGCCPLGPYTGAFTLSR